MTERFDIFSGSSDDSPLWLEVAEGLNNAVARMEQRAWAKPGRYFVYDADNGTVVASIDTDTKAKVQRAGADGKTLC